NYDVPVLASHLYSLHISFIRTACSSSCTFCFTATTPTKIYTLSLHDALPIWKIKFANLSKKVVHIHKWTGSTALIIIILHAIFTWQHFGFYFKNIKVLSGLVTGLVLAAVVTTGWMRRYRPTLRKRYFHLFLGMSMFFLIVIHILL